MINKIKINRVEEILSNEIDLFICSSSFEKRCQVIPLALSKFNVKKSYVFYNDDFSKKIKKNAKKLVKILGMNNTIRIPISLDDSSRTYIKIYKELNETLKDESIKKIVVDITTFTHEALLLLLKVLVLLKRKDQELEFLYNGAKDYSVNEVKPEDKWLTKGVKDSRTIIGYSGITDLTLKDHLIIVFGFEKDRTNKLINDFEYNNITLAFGKEDGSIKKSHYIINKKRHEELVNSYENINELEMTLTDPDIAKKEILEYVATIDENVVVMPMNNKLSTLGIGLAAIENKKIQLYYSLAARYNKSGYSKPSKSLYHYKLDI